MVLGAILTILVQWSQCGGEHGGRLDEDGENGPRHHGQVSSQPAQTSDGNISVDDVLDHTLHFLTQQRIQCLDHAYETSAQHCQGNGQQNDADISFPDMDTLGSQMSQQIGTYSAARVVHVG